MYNNSIYSTHTYRLAYSTVQYIETFRNPPSKMKMEKPDKVEVLSNKL